MGIHDALEVLGLTADTDLNSARRAYLRLLRKHRPERDPEGFQRIRGAYEVVLEHFEGRENTRAVPRSPDMTAEPAPTAQAVETPETAAPEAASTETTGPELTLTPFAVQLERFESEEPDEQRRLELLAEARKTLEQAAEPWRLLVALEQTQRLFFALVGKGFFDEASRLDALIEEHIDVKLDSVASPLADTVLLQCIFRLELQTLPESFPASLRRAFGEAFWRGDIEIAKDAVHNYALENPLRAPSAANMLAQTPNLFHQFHHLLSGSQSEDYGEVQHAVPILTLFLLLIFALRSCNG